MRQKFQACHSRLLYFSSFFLNRLINISHVERERETRDSKSFRNNATSWASQHQPVTISYKWGTDYKSDNKLIYRICVCSRCCCCSLVEASSRRPHHTQLVCAFQSVSLANFCLSEKLFGILCYTSYKHSHGIFNAISAWVIYRSVARSSSPAAAERRAADDDKKKPFSLVHVQPVHTPTPLASLSYHLRSC